MKIKLRKPKLPPIFGKYRCWKRAKPFVVNPRGILIHRVRYVVEIMHSDPRVFRGRKSHFNVTYWCGNGANIDPELIDESLYGNPPKSRLLCENCERIAKQCRQKNADQLAGRHVHTGRLQAIQTCCGGLTAN